MMFGTTWEGIGKAVSWIQPQTDNVKVELGRWEMGFQFIKGRRVVTCERLGYFWDFLSE